MGDVLQAVGIGMLVMLVGTIPRNILFTANLRYQPSVPWAVPLTAAYLCAFWWYLRGGGPPDSTSEMRRTSLRANRVSGRTQPETFQNSSVGQHQKRRGFGLGPAGIVLFGAHLRA